MKAVGKKATPRNPYAHGQAILAAESGTSYLVRFALPISIFLLTFVAFLPALQNGFVNWDDEALLLDNLHYRGLGWEQLRWMFTTCYLGSCRPLTWVTLGFDYLIWGINPMGYHLSSMLLHAVNAVLFYFVSLRLLRFGLRTSAASTGLPIRLAAVFSALFFSLHPLRVEEVAWANGRDMEVAGFFLFLTLLAYLAAAENALSGGSCWRWMSLSWLFYALSLLSKEGAMTLPFALVVLDVYPLRRLRWEGKWFGSAARSVWLEKLPFLLAAVAAGVRAVLGKQGAGALYHFSGYGLAARFAQVLYGLAFYPWKTVFPVGLSPLYPVHPLTTFWTAPLVLSSVLVAFLTVVFFTGRRRCPTGLAAWAFYVLLLIPVSGIVAFGPYRAADHFSYLPCLAWAILAGVAFLYSWQLWDSGRVGVRIFVLTQSFALLFLVTLGVLTWNQTQLWKDSERLWRHALVLEEESGFAHNNLGLVLAKRGALEEAINEFRRAVEIDPASVEGYTNLGNFLAQSGSSQEAIMNLRRALQIDPVFVNAHNTLGNVLADSGALDEAIQEFHEALRIDPTSAMAHYNLGRALAKRGDFEQAIAEYRSALKLNAADPDIHNNLGLLLERQGRVPEAIEQFEEATRVRPTYAKAYFNLGKISAQQDRLTDAEENFRRAAQAQPDVADIHEGLAQTLAKQGKKEEALREYQVAIRLLQEQRKRSPVQQ